MQEKKDRNVAVYGLITLRTDGEKVILAQKLEVPGVEKFYRFPVPQHISEAFHHPLCNSCYEKKACSVWSSKENHYDLFMYCSDCK